MKVLTLKPFRIDAFALLHLEMLTLVTIVKVKNDRVCLTIIEYKANRRKHFKAFK